MREVIAERKTGAGMLYIVITSIGLMLICLGAIYSSWPCALLGCAFTLICIYLVIDFFRTPGVVAWIDCDGELNLGRVGKINPSEISDVSYRRASAKGIQYRWGSLTVTTYAGRHKYGFVADCEDAAKRLTELMHEARYENKKEEK